MYLQLAWRNIWRNPRRTAVIMLAIIVGVWSMIFLGAFMRGMLVVMVDNGIATLTGHIQVLQKDYPDDPAIDNSIRDPDQVERVLRDNLPIGSRWTARVRVNAIAANARHSTGITMVGIEPAREAAVSFIGQPIYQGRFLKKNDPTGILVGRALLDEFGTKPGRKLILMSQDTTGEIASRAFRIVGVFRAELEATEKQFVFITITAARKMLRMGSAISEIAVILPPGQDLAAVTDRLRAVLPADDYAVRNWHQLLPMLYAYLEMFDMYTYIWFLVVFVAMGFGIVNSTLMAVYERMREFGLLKALGQRPGRIIIGVLTETFFILVLGLLAGNLLGLISVAALAPAGIDLSALAAGAEYAGMPRVIHPVLNGRDLMVADLVVFVLGLLVAVYPAIKAARFTPVEAMMHN
ncbi:MAG: ABC transporter permease [Desulfobacterales bacterium]|nr:ABC transporter permease [Desulfobacterales bacterium]